MNKQTGYPPNPQQRNLFWGAVSHPQPGKSWIIITFDGTQIVTATAYHYSKMWNLYITGIMENQKINLYRKIEEKLQVDEEKRKQYVDFGNCPALNISFEDWVQSTVDTAQKVITQLSVNQKSTIIFLSSHPLWAKPERIRKIFDKLHLDPAFFPDLSLVSAVEERGSQRVRAGQVSRGAAIDADYYLFAIKKNTNEFQFTRKRLCSAGTFLDFAVNSPKNRGESLDVFPFIPESKVYHLILTREEKGVHSFVSVTRVETDQKKLKLALNFEPMVDTPRLKVEGVNSVSLMENITAIPPISIKTRFPALQTVVLFDGTMPADQIEPAKEKLMAMARSIDEKNKTAQFGLVVYGDYSDKLGDAEFKVNPNIPQDFFPFSQWEKWCKESVKRVAPSDFMAAMDQGIIRLDFFDWHPQAQKHVILVFSSPPHPKDAQKRPVSKLPFTPAQEDWPKLLKDLCLTKQFTVSIIYLPKKAAMESIQQEIEFTCNQMKAFNYKGEGISKINEITPEILKDHQISYRLEPDTFCIPILVEDAL